MDGCDDGKDWDGVGCDGIVSRFGNCSLWKLRHLLSSLPAYLEPLQPILAESFGPDFSSMNTLTRPYSYVLTIEILAALTDTEHVPIRIL